MRLRCRARLSPSSTKRHSSHRQREMCRAPRSPGLAYLASLLACYLALTPRAYVIKTSERCSPWRQQPTHGPMPRCVLMSSRVNGYPSDRDDKMSHLKVQPILPQHVAFICDGNSRWAKARNLPAVAGHAAGADRLVQVLKDLQELGVPHCTMYAFSTENWRRPDREVRDIWTVMEATTRQFASQLLREKIRFWVLGDLQDSRVPESLRTLLNQLLKETALATRDVPNPQTLCIALNYGGRQDVVEAAKRLASKVDKGELDVDGITEEVFSQHLGTEGLPDPDLIIRTSGECRLSNFMLWDAAYAELYFTPCFWPDFDRDALRVALQWYTRRKRRFGARVDSNATVDLSC